MAMSPEAQAEYERIMAQVAAKNGSLVAKSGSFFGWHESEWNDPEAKHWEDCGFTVPADTRAEEDTWSEFMGTFSEGDTSKHGVIVRGVSCTCGQVTGRSIRWEARMQEVAEAVFEEVFKR